jgi:hypothetical protein
MPDIKTNLLNPLPPTILNVEDSVGILNSNPVYCGDRSYSLISTDNNPVSLSLLSCATDCLKLTSSGNTVTISFTAVTYAYLGFNLPFTLHIVLQKYSAIPEAANPQTSFTFNAIIYAHDSCMSTVFNAP